MHPCGHQVKFVPGFGISGKTVQENCRRGRKVGEEPERRQFLPEANYAAFFCALNFAHRAFCAAAILLRAAAERCRRGREIDETLRPPLLIPRSAEIAASTL